MRVKNGKFFPLPTLSRSDANVPFTSCCLIAMSAPPPTSIRVLRDAGVVEVAWGDKPAARLPFHFVRCLCPCAGCIDEISGERTLNPADVPQDVTPVKLAFSGNYALKIEWSDGHDTGLYTWDLLQDLAQQCSKSN